MTTNQASNIIVAERDLALIERLARDLNELYRALKKGDANRVRDLYPGTLRLPREMEQVRRVARRAFHRGE